LQFIIKRANTLKKIQNALISVYSKEGLKEIVERLNELNVKIYSTGGTFDFIKEQNVAVRSVESLTGYPSILGGRVKTLHPKVFGGILARRELESDQDQLSEYEIPEFDLVIVDLYPFEKTVASGAEEQDIIEKIDIGGISLIRAAAKNFKDVLIVSRMEQYESLLDLLNNKDGESSLDDRKSYAALAFDVSSHYDTAIFNYFNDKEGLSVFKQSITQNRSLRYGENPHQKGLFFGDLSEVFEQLHGKEISYNNLTDLEAAINLIMEFEEPTFAVLKHNNACGLASRELLVDAWKDTLAGDPISAFGGVLISNRIIDDKSAEEINKLFFEIILAPDYENNALETLKSKKNRIILQKKAFDFPVKQFKSVLNGVLVQDKDLKTEIAEDFETVTSSNPSPSEIEDLIFANKIVKHTKSNTIVLVKNRQLLASGVGQTSRVDALKQAVLKAKTFGFNLEGAVMASDAFFPFADSVEIAHKAGITSVVQPGGSVRDKDSIDYCNEHKMSMVFTGIRHFKH
jgi:phosphoribosylaminoimidazolecarboxamide formyltransferase / IMP cyclohydrolase